MKKILLTLVLIIYILSILWLSSTWYNSYTSFHLFDDLFEWEYLDKLGHFFTSFYIGLYAYKIFGNAAELNQPIQKKWICFAGFALLLPIEILDGFSLNYGFSPADLVANLLGSIFCYAHISHKTVSAFNPKFSFHSTAFCLLRPEMLGSTFAQQTLKDYNGQTYWFSVDVNKLFDKEIIPAWLMLTVGYGAEGLLGGHDNVWQTNSGETKNYSNVMRTKRIFISVDLNASVLREKNKLFNYLFAPFVLLKFPAPAIEINFERGIVLHLIYF